MQTRVERHIKINAPDIDDICFRSKNLYNKANYLIRQEFINNGKWIRYNELDKIAQKWPEYKKLPAQTSQQILKLLDINWKSFFRAIKVWAKNPERFDGRPKLPKYKHKIKGRNIVVFTKQQCRIKDGFIHFPKKANLAPLRTKVDNLRQVRIAPQATCMVMEVVYQINIEKAETDENNILAIDLGINNLATLVNNIGEQPIIINGRPLKSMNQFFHKQRALFQSWVGDKGTSNRIKRLTHKRNMKINDYLHKTSAFIRSYCIDHRIGTVIIGKNNGWKQSIELGKKNNQNFVSIPFNTLIQQLKYKLGDIGIKVIIIEESYTSKVDHFALESLDHHDVYLGKRIKRGLFQSSIGKLLNADVNGALGIFRKVAGDVCFKELISRGQALSPVRFSIS